MRFLFLTQYYPPEIGAAQNRISDQAQRFADWGHEITVITAMPSYPIGRVFEGYRRRLLREDVSGPIRILRTWTYVTESKTFILRLLNYFSFVLASVVIALWKAGPQDAIIVESPPLFLGLPGIMLSRLWRAKLVFNVSDLWPESAVAMGVLRSGSLIRFSTGLEEFIYQNCDLITGQTRGIIASIQSRIKHVPVLLLTNGIDSASFTEENNREEMRCQLGFQKTDFVAGYTGRHGLAQGLEVILEAAERVSQHRDVVFGFFGDGPEKPALEKIAQDKGLTNVRFFPPQPKASMPRIMRALDISIVPLKRHDLFKGALPSKLFESMGSGVPVVLTIEGEARDLVEQAGGGICVPPEEPDALAQAILLLKSEPELRTSIGQNGRHYMITHYDRHDTAKRFEQALLQLLSGGGSATAPQAIQG